MSINDQHPYFPTFLYPLFFVITQLVTVICCGYVARLMTSRGCGRLLLVVLEGCNLTASDQSGKAARRTVHLNLI